MVGRIWGIKIAEPGIGEEFGCAAYDFRLHQHLRGRGDGARIRRHGARNPRRQPTKVPRLIPCRWANARCDRFLQR